VETTVSDPPCRLCHVFATAAGFSSAWINSAPCPGARCEYRMVIVVVLWPNQACTWRSGTPAETD